MIGLIADAVLPIAWILALGFGLKRYVGIEEVIWRGLEKISYWVLMPSLLAAVIIKAPRLEIPWSALVGSMYGTFGLISIILVIAWKLRLLGSSYPSFTSLYQGSVRFNTFISMALIVGLNPLLLPHLGIAAAIFIVALNICCVVVITAGHTGGLSRRVFREIVKNPLIIACVLGGLGRLADIPYVFPITGLDLVGQAALPMGVLCLGAGLQWNALRSGIGLALLAVVIQLVLKPLLFIGLALWFELSAEWLLVGLLLMCVSTAPSSFILARQLGGDAPLMAGIVAIQTVLAIVSVPLFLWFAEEMNWMNLI
jgi:malonate transporter